MWFWKKKEEVTISDIIETVVQDGKTFDVFYMEMEGKKYWHFLHEGKLYEMLPDDYPLRMIYMPPSKS